MTISELWRFAPLAVDEAFIALPAILLIFGTPIIWILTAHQRKMAELMRQQPQGDVRIQQQMESLQMQVNELRGLVQEHIIRSDQPTSVLPPPTPNLENRLNG